MIKYACDKCGDEIPVDGERWIFRIQEANHKSDGNRTVCLCGICKEVLEEHYPALFKIGFVAKGVKV